MRQQRLASILTIKRKAWSSLFGIWLLIFISYSQHSYLQFLRLSVMMGLSWIFINLVWAIYVIFDTSSEWITSFVLEVSCYYGIFVFILLIARRSTVKLLKERYVLWD